MDNNQHKHGVCKTDAFLFLAGTGLGIGLGILLAPRSGQETRGAIRGRVNEGKDYLARQSRDLGREVTHQASNIADKASTLATQGKESLEKHKASVVAAVDAGRQAYRETVAETS